ncbi:unnamed protein product, partial [Polarella glacialis]
PYTDDSSVSYLRPETAQGIFVNYKQVVYVMRMKVPFGIAQIGKAFRNEITPRQFIFRSREFEQMEVEYFIDPEADFAQIQEEWLVEMWNFLKAVGLDERLMERQVHQGDKLAHYARACTDIVFRYPFGTSELMGVAARGEPIVITLKRRNGRGQPAVEEELQPRNDEEEAVDDGSTRNGDVDADEGLGRGASRSQSRSPERRSPSSKRARTLTPSSVLNVSVLEQALGRFTGELDQWLQAEAGKVEFLEAKAAVSKEFLQQSGAEVGDFLRSHAPSGPDTSGTGFATSALPRFLEMVDEDRSALSEVSIALAAFAERRGFPLTEELKASGSTLPMLK